MMSVAQAILLRNYPIERRGMAIALWSMVIIIAPIFRPIIGGWITDNLSWPWLFYSFAVGAFPRRRAGRSCAIANRRR